LISSQYYDSTADCDLSLAMMEDFDFKRINIFSLDRLSFVRHLPGHWVLIVIYPQLCEIHYYDHLNMGNGEKDMLATFRWLSDMALMTHENPTQVHPFVEALNPNDWLLQNRYQFIPVGARQRRGMACGLYVMKLIDYLDDNIPIEMVDYVEAVFDSVYRRQIACYIEKGSMGD
jgi:Ulp1 family protease